MKLLYILFLFIFCSCSSTGQYYSYQLKTIRVDKGKPFDLRAPDHYISYEPFLFEFNIGVSSNDTIYGNSEKIYGPLIIDTLSVYLLNPFTRKFVEFNEFSEQAKVIESGKFSEKKRNFKLSDSAMGPIKHFGNKPMTDTLVWGKNLHYLENFEKGHTGQDSIKNHIFFVKNPHLVTMYELISGIYTDPDYSMICYTTHVVESSDGLLNELQELRELSDKEKNICEAMLKKAGFK